MDVDAAARKTATRVTKQVVEEVYSNYDDYAGDDRDLLFDDL
jgi:hypothetical protein